MNVLWTNSKERQQNSKTARAARLAISSRHFPLSWRKMSTHLPELFPLWRIVLFFLDAAQKNKHLGDDDLGDRRRPGRAAGDWACAQARGL